MTNPSPRSENGRSHQQRSWCKFLLVLAVILIAIWMFRPAGPRQPAANSSTNATDSATPHNKVPAVAPTGSAASAATAAVPALPAPPALLFDSNRISGGTLISKGRDDKFLPDSDAPSGWSLWLRHASGAERLVSASVFSAKFSPDGRRIAYTTSDVTLRVEDLQGNKLAAVEGGYSPQWKPDGSAIVFAKVPEGRDVHLPGALHLATLDPASGEVNLLTDGRFDDGRPEFAPSGDWILFVSGARKGFASFWKFDPKRGEPVQVTNIGQRAVDETFVPTPYRKTLWSPDGRWFIYDFKSGEREQIWGLQFTANGDLMRATKFADGLDPIWSEDGRSLVYSKRVNEQTESAVVTLP